MAANFTKTKASGETVGYWRKEIARALEMSDRHKTAMRCEELRRAVSENDFGVLVLNDEIEREDNPHIDQIDVNYLLRYVDKMRALTGDEEPEVRFSRTRTVPKQISDQLRFSDGQPVTPATLGETFDRLVSETMAVAGAPDENNDAIASECTDGLNVFWWELTGHPSQRDAVSASLPLAARQQAAQQGQTFVGRLDDHDKITQELMSKALSDPDRIEDETASNAPGEAPFVKEGEAAAEHARAAEEETKGTPFYWRDGKFQLKETRYVYGERFCWDSTTTRFKDARFVARLLEMPPDEGREHPMFRPSVAEKLVVSPWESDDADDLTRNEAITEKTAATAARAAVKTETDPEDGVIKIWQVEDRKYLQVMYFPHEGGDQFLYDGPSSYVDVDGEPLIPPIGPYPGFFPVYGMPVKPLAFHDSPRGLIGMPLLLPGLDIQHALIKAVSQYSRATKQAAAQYMFLEGETYDEYSEIVRRGNGAIMSRVPGGTGGEIIQWRPPPPDLFNIIGMFVGQLSAALNFPIAEMTSQPQADTATQEEIALGAGNLNVFETIRRMEMVYSVRAWICVHLLFKRLAHSGLIERIVGVEDARILRATWGNGYFVHRLPQTTMAPKARNEGKFVEIKQLLDLHARYEAVTSPATGLPVKDPTFLLDEASKRMGVGEIPDWDISQEQKIAAAANLMVQKMVETGQLIDPKQLETEAAPPSNNGSGGANDKGTPKKAGGRRDGEKRRDSERGRGAGQPRPRGIETGNARDLGPVTNS